MFLSPLFLMLHRKHHSYALKWWIGISISQTHIDIIILLVVEIELKVLYMLDSVLILGCSFTLPCYLFHLFIFDITFMYLHAWAHVALCVCGSQRTTFRSWFSPSTMSKGVRPRRPWTCDSPALVSHKAGMTALCHQSQLTVYLGII